MCWSFYLNAAGFGCLAVGGDAAQTGGGRLIRHRYTNEATVGDVGAVYSAVVADSAQRTAGTAASTPIAVSPAHSHLAAGSE